MRLNLLEWIRDYCNDGFYGDAVGWKDDTDYEIGDLVIGDDTHVYRAITDHTSNDDPPPDNTTDWLYTEETLPGGIVLALNKLEVYEAQNPIKGESLGDYSVQYAEGLPPHIKSKLTTYRSMKW